MKRYSTGGWLLLLTTALLAAACSHLPLQEREVIVPLSRLTEAISRRIGDERKVLEVFRVRVADPKLAADSNAQRLRADFALTLTHPFSSRPLTGRAALSGVLGYDAESKNVVLHEPRIDRLDFRTQVLGVALRQGVVEIGVEAGVFIARDQQRGFQQGHGFVGLRRQ